MDLKTAVLSLLKPSLSLLNTPPDCDKTRSKVAVDHKGRLVKVHYRNRKSEEVTEQQPTRYKRGRGKKILSKIFSRKKKGV